MNTRSAPDENVIEQAIAWRVCLESGTASPHDHDACTRWRSAHADHEMAWQTLAGIGDRVRTVPASLARRALHRPAVSMNRRAALRSLLLLGGTGTALYASRDWRGWQPFNADIATGVGERRTQVLADGSRLDLNTDSAVDLQYDAQWRRVRLRRGEIVVATAHPADAAVRPFVVDTGHGRIRALGTRFSVRQHDDVTDVSVFEGAVEVTPRDAAQPFRVEAGQSLRFDRDAASMPGLADTDAAAWVDGVLIARDQRLDDFVEALARHRPGILRCAAEASELRISGVYPLEYVDAILAALERTLPVTVQRRTAWWLTVRLRT